MVVRDTVVVGAALLAGTAPRSRRTSPGYMRGYRRRPANGCGSSTPFRGPASSATRPGRTIPGRITGNTGVWAPMSADEELGYVYLPVETPTGDFYGGHRPGNNLFADSLVCLDATTGKRVWHFQLVHHGIWDYDTVAPPMLVDITVDGRQHQGRGAGDQAGVHLRVRSRDRQAGVADRGTAGAAVRRAGREDLADAAVSDQAAGVRPAGRHTRRSDRFHARAEGGGA